MLYTILGLVGTGVLEPSPSSTTDIRHSVVDYLCIRVFGFSLRYILVYMRRSFPKRIKSIFTKNELGCHWVVFILYRPRMGNSLKSQTISMVFDICGKGTNNFYFPSRIKSFKFLCLL